MAEQLFYVEDTVCLKTDRYQIGVVDRTFGNLETHSPNPEQDTLNGTIRRGKDVPAVAFYSFLNTGIPPQGTVLISWVFDNGLDDAEWDPILMREEDLELLDRALLFGDIVKRSSRDAASGTVVQAETTASILQPLRWPAAGGSAHDSGTGVEWHASREIMGNFPHPHAYPEKLLQDIPVDELRWANEYEIDDIILYRGWVGLIQEIDDDVYIRLDNNSVVVPEDSSELRGPDGETCQINDFVTTRKANLRRGKWIYGAYDANLEPGGFVVDIRPRSLAVQWLVSKYPKGGDVVPSEPPPELERQELDSGEIKVYDRRRQPNFADDQFPTKSLVTRRANLDVAIGDRVRFVDLNKVAEKFNASPEASSDPAQGILQRIPRGETLGYDINVFTIVEIKTRVDVLWQDGTISKDLPSADLVPYLDLDNEEEVWPGELVMTKEEADPQSDYFVPARAGIVQSVNAQDRMARVRWFHSSYLHFTRDRPPWLLSDSHTSRVSGESEEISLYDIFTTADFARRLGDLVVVVPSAVMERADDTLMGLEDVQDVVTELVRFEARNLSARGSLIPISQPWIGEVIDFGLDGLLTLSLGACEPPRQIRVPWECTYIAHSSDQEDNLDISDDTGADTSDGISMTSSMSMEPWEEEVYASADEGVWRDEDGNIVEMDKSSQWSTDDDEHMDSSDDNAVDRNLEHEDVEMTDLAPKTSIGNRKQAEGIVNGNRLDGSADPSTPKPFTNGFHIDLFSYTTMFSAVSSDAAAYNPPKFAILEGSAPADHHFANRREAMGGKIMRNITKEHKMLRDSLPDGAYARVWESNMNLMRVLLLGPLDTPYEYAPFVFDFYMDASFPHNPPEVFFHSWTDGRGPCNPNLYEDGKVCLSLLGTWPGDEKNEGWNAGKSSILQVIVSLLGLVLVKEPYFNEAGFEVRVGTVESQIPSAQYSERTFFRTRGFIAHAIRNPIKGFEEDILSLYLGADEKGPRLLRRAIESAIEIVRQSKTGRRSSRATGEGRRVTAGALAPLTRQIETLLGILGENDRADAKALQMLLKDAAT